MRTLVERFNEESLQKAAEILKRGGICAIPTETVYGLAANALDETAVESIFAAKGRPQDNPLIVHISGREMLPPLVKEVPPLAELLADSFWPGPLTMIFDKSEAVPSVTSGGLDTVAVRMPACAPAREIIRACGFPLAAPSANTSGKPSPTAAAHVYEDMSGKIPLIIDGGECSVGVESTVICFREGRIHVLRPGGITAEQLSRFAEVELDRAVEAAPREGEKVLSPGMKYKHYSPKADVFIVNARGSAFADFCRENAGENALCLSRGETAGAMFLDYGATAEEQARRLFALLRLADERGADKVYVEMPDKCGVGLAVYNRLLRAAAYRVIEV